MHFANYWVALPLYLLCIEAYGLPHPSQACAGTSLSALLLWLKQYYARRRRAPEFKDLQHYQHSSRAEPEQQ